MKRFDFSKPGGFPLSQDRLKYMQDAYTEAINALGGIAGAGPYILAGMTTSVSGMDTIVAPGWIYYNGEVVRFGGASYTTAIGFGTTLYVVISTPAGPLAYDSGSTYNVVIDRVATLSMLADTTPDDADNFKYSGLKKFGVALAATYKDSVYASVALSGAGGVSGTLYYKKNTLTNTLHIHGGFISLSPSAFATLPSVSSTLLATLPTGYRPAAAIAPFMAMVSVGGDLAVDDSGGLYPGLKCFIQTDGKFYVDFVKSSSAGAFVFNAIIPLD